MVVVGADRIAANGDTANKIGTYTVAIAAKYHNVPFTLQLRFQLLIEALNQVMKLLLRNAQEKKLHILTAK